MTRVMIAGAGPAGIAAACRASESGAQVTVIDDNAAHGGQIWRGGSPDAWFRRFRGALIEFQSATRVISCDCEARTLTLETDDSQAVVGYDKLILATGARELFLPFPGWTLPGITGAGGLQALVKSGLPVERKQVVVAGTGPLLIAVAAYLKSRGSRIAAIVEQAPFSRLAGFATRLLASPDKLWQALRLRVELLGVPYRTSQWVEAAEGDSHLRQVRLAGRPDAIPCDYLACGYGLVPNTELASLLGCIHGHEGVVVNELQETSTPGVYAAGEVTGIGGLELSLVEGEIAGYAAAGRTEEPHKLQHRRGAAQRFARALEETFALRPELKGLPRAETLVCRCEDVPYQKLQQYGGWREAKLQTRCGMGPCQGRVCGAAAEFLFGWKHSGVRPPVLPARVGSLSGAEEKL